MKHKKTTLSVSVTGAQRYNKGKARLSKVPKSLDEAVAHVLHKSSIEGGGKYPDHNWRLGLPFTEVADSALRHLKSWLEGEDLDAESGLPHTWHVATNIAFIIEYQKTVPELDNRYKPKKRKL